MKDGGEKGGTSGEDPIAGRGGTAENATPQLRLKGHPDARRRDGCLQLRRTDLGAARRERRRQV